MLSKNRRRLYVVILRCLVFLKIPRRLFPFIFFGGEIRHILLHEQSKEVPLKEHLPFHSPAWKCARGAGETDKKDESSASILILGEKFTEDFVESMLIPSMYC